MNPSYRTTPELEALVSLFYGAVHELGDFQEISAGQMPDAERVLLDHDQHMTLTIEAHHGCRVGVHVLETRQTATHYTRKIALQRKTDGVTVQFGIVRLHLDLLAADVFREIHDQRTPIGRILIQHNVLRNVRLLSLWQVRAGDELSAHFSLKRSSPCYGRTALIYCDTVPAVELLEIVRPDESLGMSE